MTSFTNGSVRTWSLAAYRNHDAWSLQNFAGIRECPSTRCQTGSRQRSSSASGSPHSFPLQGTVGSLVVLRDKTVLKKTQKSKSFRGFLQDFTYVSFAYIQNKAQMQIGVLVTMSSVD